MRVHVALPEKSVIVGFDGIGEFNRLRRACRSAGGPELHELAELLDAQAEAFSPQQELPDVVPVGSGSDSAKEKA